MRGWTKTKKQTDILVEIVREKRRDHVEIVRELTVVMISAGEGGGVLWVANLLFKCLFGKNR